VIEHSRVPCRDWTGRLDPTTGYGYLYIDGKKWYAHRWIFLRKYGYLPRTVRHACDRPPCIESTHLLPGIQADNIRDMHERGRAVKAQGTANGKAKLTTEQIIEIRKRYPRESGTTLAREFGVHHTWIYRIVRGEVRRKA
jgi:hypothetical protein